MGRFVDLVESSNNQLLQNDCIITLNNQKLVIILM